MMSKKRLPKELESKILDLTVFDLGEMMDKGELSSLELIDFYLNRIHEIDKAGPSINSILELNDDAREIALSLDKERLNKGKRSKLHGIPILLKANIDTADSMTTSAGSLALKDHRAKKDAHIVKILRDAGLVILGKTNLSEWANFRSTRSSSGWSSLGGQTLNPYALDRSPCGSSSGSAVAMAAGLCTLAIGTETDGSIVCPSHVNGIVGIKPSMGLVSRSGIIPIAESQDTAGPMTRNVADGAALLDLISSFDPLDHKKSHSLHGNDNSFTKSLDPLGLKGARIGVARNYFGKHEKIDAIMEENICLLKEAGATIIDPIEVSIDEKLDDCEFEVLLYEFKKGIDAYLSHCDGQVKSLEELVIFNKSFKNETMTYFEQELLEMALAQKNITEESYRESLKKCSEYSRKMGLDKTFKKDNLHAIIAPTGGLAWKIDLITGDHYGENHCCQIAAVAGYPHITVPAGHVWGLPVGLSFIGAKFSDCKLISLAYAFEQLSKARKDPTFKKDVLK